MSIRGKLLKQLMDDYRAKKTFKLNDEIQIDNVKFKVENVGNDLVFKPTDPKFSEVNLTVFENEYVTPKPEYKDNRISYSKSLSAYETRLNELAKNIGLDETQAKAFVKDNLQQVKATPLYKLYEVQQSVEDALKGKNVNADGALVQQNIVSKEIEKLKSKIEANQPLKVDDIKPLQSELTKIGTSMGDPELLSNASKKLTDLTEVVNEAATSGRISPKVKAILLGSLALTAAVGIGLGVGRSLPTEAALAEAAKQHQDDLNGCWLYDYKTNTRTKVKLLTCGDYDLASAIETCETQPFTSTSTAIRDCPSGTFNPCAKESKSRASNSSVPLVPDVCDFYLYKGTAPAAVTGVKVQDACKTPDGKALDTKQACSPYCKTSNFNLKNNLELYCVSVDYPTALYDLLVRLGVPPPPPPPPPADSAASNKLKIAAGVLGGIFVLLLVVYFFF